MRKLIRVMTAVGVGSLGVLLADHSSAWARGETPAAAATAPTMAPQDAYDLILSTSKGKTEHDKDKVAAAEAALTAAAPPDARWEVALAYACQMRGANPDCKAHAEKALALDPKNADAHYLLATAMFNGMGDASMMEKMAIADKGKKEYEKALECDPNHAGAHVGLGTFYTEAPGIAGGSIKKAKEHANALLKIDGAEIDGHTMMARACAEDSDWKGMAAEFDAAASACKTDPQKLNIAKAHAGVLLRKKEDPKAAIAVLEKAQSLATTPDASMMYIHGAALQKLKDYPAAIEKFRAVLAVNANAMNTRYALAQCLEEQENWADAAKEYTEFATRFPKEARAEDATKSAAKMTKKAEKAAGAKK